MWKTGSAGGCEIGRYQSRNLLSSMGLEVENNKFVNADFILTHHRRFRTDPPGDFLLVRW
jgi:hypothetical protein